MYLPYCFPGFGKNKIAKLYLRSKKKGFVPKQNYNSESILFRTSSTLRERPGCVYVLLETRRIYLNPVAVNPIIAFLAVNSFSLEYLSELYNIIIFNEQLFSITNLITILFGYLSLCPIKLPRYREQKKIWFNSASTKLFGSVNDSVTHLSGSAKTISWILWSWFYCRKATERHISAVIGSHSLHYNTLKT